MTRQSSSDDRRWTLTRSHPMTTSFDGPRLELGESVEVVPAAENALLERQMTEVDSILIHVMTALDEGDQFGEAWLALKAARKVLAGGSADA